MSDIGLYFPYVHLPSDAWVKAAALHWPQLGRMVPSGYWHLNDSDTVKQLREELDFIINIAPSMSGQGLADRKLIERVDPEFLLSTRYGVATEEAVDALFYDFLNRHQDELIPRFGAEAIGVTSLDTAAVYDEHPPLDPRLATIHPGKMSYRLVRRLEEAGLLVSLSYYWRRPSDGMRIYVRDLAVHVRLADVYLAVLADAVARQNQMTPITDQAMLCATTSGWTIEALAQILLDDAPEQDQEVGGYEEMFALLALQTVLPRNLAEVPVERIIEARRRLLPDMLRYREYLNSLTSDFIEISALPDPHVRAAKLSNHVESKIAEPIETMERELGRLGLQPVRAVLSMQSLAPPAALSILGSTMDLPSAVTGTGVVAGCLVGAASSALDRRRQILTEHPVGYLLHLRGELSPSDTVAQIRSAMRRAMPQRRKRRFLRLPFAGSR